MPPGQITRTISATPHAPRNIFPILNGGDASILYCFLFLYLAFAGGGAWSLDQRFWKR